MNPDPALKSVISKGSMKEILLPSIMYLKLSINPRP